MKSRLFTPLTVVLAIACISGAALSQVAGPIVANQSNEAPRPAPDSGAPIDTAVEETEEPVEDAPVEMPVARTDWVPPETQDPDYVAEPPPPVIKSKRKTLNDAGPASDIAQWDTNGDSQEASTAALIARTQRRERAIDPTKRADLVKLARIMGALHALRVSCSGRDDQTYRSRMATLLDLEAPESGGIRDPLVDAFNTGFQTYGRGSSVCPTDSRNQEASLAKDGHKMAKLMAARYRPAAAPATHDAPAMPNGVRTNAVSKSAAKAGNAIGHNLQSQKQP